MNTPSSAETTPPPLRLSILHLMMWMTGTALLATYLRDFPIDRYRGTFGAVLLTTQMVHAVVGGISIASVGMLIQYGFRQPARFPREPGHWLLLAGGIASVAGLVTHGIMHALHSDAQLTTSQILLSHAILHMAMATVLGISLWSIQQRFWLFLFAIETLVLCAIAYFALQSWANGPVGSDANLIRDLFVIRLNMIVFGVVLFIRTLGDLMSKPRPFDWLHYVAMGCWFARLCNGLTAAFVLPLLQ